MTIAGCEEQIIRIKSASFQPELNEALEAQLRERVKIAVQTTVEGALEAELAEDLAIGSMRSHGVRAFSAG